MKKPIAIALILTLIMCSVVNVSFANDDEMLFATDFESDLDIIGNAPNTIAGFTSNPAIYTNAVVNGPTEDYSSKYINLVNGNAGRVRGLFNKPVSSGVVIIEFDANPGNGNLGLSLLYDNSLATYGKWIMGLNGTESIYAYTKEGAQPPKVLTGFTETLKDENSDIINFKMNKWQHFKIKIDIDNAAITYDIDGTISKKITGYQYIGGNNPAIGGFGFYVNKPATVEDVVCLDNIKAYIAPLEVTDLSIIDQNDREVNDLSMVNPDIYGFKVVFSSEANLDSVSVNTELINNTLGESITLSNFTKDQNLICFNLNGERLSDFSEYTLTIKKETEDMFGKTLKEDYIFNFKTDDGIESSRITYYKTDFENDTVGNASLNVLGYSSSASTAECVVEQQESKVLSVNTRVRAIMTESAGDGTICVEFDSNMGYGSLGFGVLYESNLVNYGKWLYGFQRVSSASNAGILAYTDVNALPPAILANYTETVTTEQGTDMKFLTNEWQHYKIVLDLDNQTSQIIIDGEKSAVTSGISFIGKNNPKIGGIVFYTSRGNTADKVKLDNIAVYRADNDVTDIKFNTYDNTIVTAENTIPAMSANAEVTFANRLTETSDLGLVTLYNETNKNYDNISCTLLPDLRSIIVSPINGYFEPNSQYTLCINRLIRDSLDQLMRENYECRFITDGGGVKIFDFYVSDGLNRVTNVSNSDNVKINIDYAIVGDAPAIESVLGIVYENNLYLNAINTQNILLDLKGRQHFEKDYTVNSTTDFDKLNIFLWDKYSKGPKKNCISLYNTSGGNE